MQFNFDPYAPYLWEFNSAAERLAFTKVSWREVGRQAIQKNDKSIWALTSENPITWARVDGAGGAAEGVKSYGLIVVPPTYPPAQDPGAVPPVLGVDILPGEIVDSGTRYTSIAAQNVSTAVHEEGGVPVYGTPVLDNGTGNYSMIVDVYAIYKSRVETAVGTMSDMMFFHVCGAPFDGVQPEGISVDDYVSSKAPRSNLMQEFIDADDPGQGWKSFRLARYRVDRADGLFMSAIANRM